MSRHAFYPYSVASDGVRLSVQLDPEVPLGSEGAHLVYEEAPESLHVDIRAKLGPEASSLMDNDRYKAREISVVVSSLQSRKRLQHRLAQVEGDYETSIEFQRREWSGDVEVQAVVAVSEPGLRKGAADEKGVLISWSRPVRLVFDEPPFPPGGSLKVEWADFGAERDLDLKHLFAIRERNSEPVILLNQVFPEAVAVLESKGTRGAKARVRDATFQMIVHQGWSSLLATALKSLMEVEEGATAEEAFSELGGWQERVLRSWASHLVPESDALDELYRRIHQPGFLAELLVEKLPDAVQSRFKTYKGFDGLVRDVLR